MYVEIMKYDSALKREECWKQLFGSYIRNYLIYFSVIHYLQQRKNVLSNLSVFMWIKTQYLRLDTKNTCPKNTGALCPLKHQGRWSFRSTTISSNINTYIFPSFLRFVRIIEVSSTSIWIFLGWIKLAYCQPLKEFVTFHVSKELYLANYWKYLLYLSYVNITNTGIFQS